ncbi:NADP-dependent glyceraldehyde-3-phosphate dehydrogenase [Aceticella autotrophica]|uniref:NADP-dependent glyceraldehyde-3-phosphate dehydrogenase n=1 Tax=Aceticella autotrophica TaxID=2755338 RepID=A0A975AX46_9THEO|nr:NADP-dependent glyceraldehyde-3-phosphate dehydrogenase [Aceticella autotrophica]QSZ28099.1 NADP-dependent glyceraldehyde-3-phosphate dehydrogenase [Aceticella autotrophica]
MNVKENFKDIFPDEKAIPAEFTISSPIIQKEYLLDGKLCQWEGDMQEVYSPIYTKTSQGLSKKFIGKYPLLTEKEAMEALKSALNAYDEGRGQWPTMAVADRIKHVEEFAFRFKEKKKEVVNLLMWEICKSYEDSLKEFDRTVEYIMDTIDAMKDLDRISSRFVIEDGVIAQIRRSPLGVVMCMGPYNYPLNETFTTLIPALIMGNTVILKPPKMGVLLHRPILSIFKDCFPKGVVNTIYGQGQQVVAPIIASGKVNVLAFIGSSEVADILRKQHPKPHRLRCVLGLESKNAAIILPDVDLNMTVKECILGTLSFNGQRCTALKILFVHSDIIDAFLDKFANEIDRLKVGMPWETNVNITPIPSNDRIKYLEKLIQDARDLGANIINNKGGIIKESLFYPTVLYPVNDKMKIYHEEQFGPVIPVVPFDDIEIPTRYIIESNYGQQVSLFAKDPDIISKLIDSLVNQVCRVNINSQCQRGPDVFPFTGRKDSAEGTLSVSDALRAFSIRTLVAAKENDINKEIITKILKERKSNFLSTDFIF